MSVLRVQRALVPAQWLQRSPTQLPRTPLRALHAPAPYTGVAATCERHRGATGLAPPGTDADVAGGLCNRSATRRRRSAAGKSLRRHQGRCWQRAALKTSGVRFGASAAGGSQPSSETNAGARSSPGTRSFDAAEARRAALVCYKLAR